MIKFTTLSKGSKGVNVTALQFFLRAEGYLSGTGKVIDVDGDFGNETKGAVINFQKVMNAYGANLRTDGVFDANCYRKVLGA